MTAAEHQRARPVEAVEHRRGLAPDQSQHGQPDQQHRRRSPVPPRRCHARPAAAASSSPVCVGARSRMAPAAAPAAMTRTCDSGEAIASDAMAAAAAMRRRRVSGARDRAIRITAWATTATAASLSPCTQPAVAEVGRRGQQAECDHRDRRRRGEPDPGGNAAEDPGAAGPDRDPQLAAGRARQHLAERHEVRKRRLVQPSPSLHVLAPVVADVGDRAAEGCQAEAQRGTEDLEGGARSWFAHGHRLPAQVGTATSMMPSVTRTG